jgi:GNAT superfamily N-acetyltransferase
MAEPGALQQATIAAANDAQAPLCRRWLPAAFARTGPAPELLVASVDGGACGALALEWCAGGFALHMHVEPGQRRRGIGSALQAAAIALARGETAALRAAAPVSQGSPAAAFLQARGFAVTRHLLVFDSDGERYSATLTALLRRAHKRVPPKTELVALAATPAGVVAGLIAAEFDVPRYDVIAKLDPGHADAYEQQLSQVLLHDGVAAGAILGRRYGDTIEVDINVVTPALRHGVANLMLLEAIGRLSRQAGVQRFRFSCEAHVSDTVHLGERSSAQRLPDRLLYALTL